ncbi:RNA exonuclease 1 like protein [Chelonia mydas]|uniref:RNA exonuclease 1 like protein n=1 Tax=Chelonia mydas TaxID=8469 RepID=M7ASC3_CHEMY|nr:RNA exonuclease 1 like protein [Chelonia mydas]
MHCRVKPKELRNAYCRAREANCRSSAAPATCRFYKELDAILGGDPTSTPKTTIDTSESSSTRQEEEECGSKGAEEEGDSPASLDACSQELFSSQEEGSQSQQMMLGEEQTPEEVPELGYDPYNPELPKPSTQIANGALGDIAVSTPSILQLELVNKAIEEVRYEVEREQKKYEELLETTKEYSTSEASSLISKTSVSAAVTKTDSLEYNPGSYNLNNNTDYNPTPLAAASSSKYTLDTFDNAKSKGSSLEYVPKVVAQPKKYSSVVPNNKYVIDDSKPSTDLEYDPLSNYSARLLSKASTKEQKGTKRRKVSSYGESYSPSRKKHCNVSNNYGTYAKFSDSEEDVDLEYQPTSVSRLQSKVSSENESSDGLSVKEKSTKLEDLNSREMKEMAVQYDMEDIESPRKNLVKDLSEKNTKLAKASSSKNEQNVEDKDSKEIAKDKMKKKKTDGSKPPCHKEMGKEKSKNTKKERTVKKEEKLKIKNGEKSCKEKSIKAKPDGNLKKSEKEKLEKVAKKEKSKSTSCAASSGKSKSEGLWKGASPEKLEGSTKDSIVKAADLKNGKQASRDKHKDKGGKTSASDRPKKKASPAKVGNSKGKCKPKQRTLSHVDLFGDESGEEEKVGQPPATFPNMSSDSDGDDGSCGFQSDNEGTKSIQRSKLSKSSSSSSSSDDIDYSVLEKDLDYDSDPMEECLRIFNESTDVKTEDKGRLGKQPLKEEASEEKMDDALTTLFPGQKRRISHLAKQGNADVPNKPVIRPYRPPTAQEVCYRRIQLAQQQAAQLAVAVQRASLALPGEKKRIAHVPNVALSTAAKQITVGIKKTIPVSSVTAPNGSEAPALTLKARTLTGMTSKTTTTALQKRIAHAPSLQSASLKRPVIPTEFGAKVPTNIRQRYLNLFIDECLKFCSSSQEAFDKALSEEKVAYERSTSRNIYLNVAVNTLKKLRSLVPNSPPCVNITVGIKKTIPVSSVTAPNGSEAPALTLKARTLTGMTSKTTTTALQKRIAHAPSLQSASLKRPVIPTEFGAKVPTNIRQRYLNLFIDECLKFCSSSQEAFDKALSEEKVAYERSTSRNIYLNVAVNTLKKLRSLVPNSPPCVNKTSNRKVVSHEAVLGGKLAAKTSFTLNQSGNLRAEDLTGAALYRRLKEYLLTEEQMKENGYPMPHPEKAGRAVVFTVEEKKTTDSSCRVCCRCGTEYMVSPSGNCIRKEECLHHWGRLRKQRVPGGWETHYSCCSGAVGSPGCQVAKQHVQDGRKENLEGFVKTFEKLPTTDGYPGIYALDCEMCYTKQGLELTRVTVINSDLKVVYDTFVKPDNKVVDYNTRFSGVTEEDLANASITLRDVQAVLLNMFSTDTILIGHSLESDLFALKLIHSTVVDTAVVFPHRLGLPYKRALRTLMADYLKRIIQDNVEGHDSSEDASACMELMIWKIKEDAKVKR